MSLADCIDRAVAGGEMDARLGEDAKVLFQKLQRDYARKMASPAADQAAADDTLKALRHETLEKHRRERLQMLNQARLAKAMTDIVNHRGQPDEGLGLVAALGQSEAGAAFSTVELRRKAVRSQTTSRMADFLTAARTNIIGGRKRADDIDDLVREAHGTDTGNAAAKEWLKGWREGAEYLRRRFNAAGGSIAKLDDWGMPQTHDTLKVRAAGFDAWRVAILPKLDVGNMRSSITGLPLERAELDDALRQVFDSISQEGWNKIKPSGQAGGKAMASRYTDHRFLRFKSADDWLTYNKDFGSGQPFDTMMAYVERMSRDIAMMEVLGPNPAATMTWAEQLVSKRVAARDAAEGGGKHSERLQGRLHQARTLYEMHMNTNLSPANSTFAASMQGLRHFLVAAQLGGAFISSLTDIGLQRLATRHAGLPAWGSVRRAAGLFARNSDADRALALRLGLIADGMIGASHATSRYLGELAGPEIARRFSDATMRLSGLSAWTQAGQWAFGMEFMGAMADFSGKAMGELPDAFARTLKRYGFDDAAWDAIRATPHYTEGGATFLRYLDIEDERLATRVAEMISGETQFAVPTGQMRARAVIVGRAKPGTIPGELLQSAAMYKQFSITLVFTHAMRMLNQDSLRGKLAYAASLMISMTLLGGMAMQMKEIAKGRDPRAMFDKDGRPSEKFVGAAILQGGGLGIFGDLLFSDLNRFGGGFEKTLAGPVAGFATDALNLTAGNVAQAVQGEKTNFGNELTGFVRRYTPGGSLWYARLAYERVALDQMQHAIDPQAQRRFRRTMRNRQREQGQDYWWRPGELSPRRAPDLAAAGG